MVQIKSLMEMFDGGNLEHKILEKSGYLNYKATGWETVKPDLYERHLCFKFNRHVSIFGGEVTCTQQKSPIGNENGWILNEVMALHDIPFGDHFRVGDRNLDIHLISDSFFYCCQLQIFLSSMQVHFRYQIENFGLAPGKCKCEVHMEILWLKSTVFQQRITRNITEKFTRRLKEIIELVEREALLNCPQDSSP